MSKLDRRHPSEDDLMRYSDGELSGRDAAEVRAHLEACWDCRAEYDEIQKVIGDCARFRKAALESYLPPPPEPWRDIRRQFSEVDSRLGSRLFWARIGELLLAPVRRPGRFAQAGIAVAVAIALIIYLGEAPKVEAAELLKKAVVAGESRETKPRRLRVRQGGAEFTRVIGLPGAQVAAKQDSARVAALFSDAHYSWDDPLSARSYLEWYEQLADKNGEVTPVPGASLVRTTTSSGDLIEATLKLRNNDLVAIEGTFHFRNHEIISVSQLEELPPGVVVHEPVAGLRVPSSERAISASAPAELPAVALPLATSGDELRVVAALHRLGADLGDPIEVVREGSAIRVTGVGIDAGRRAEIAQALGALPRVETDFQDMPAMPREMTSARAVVRRPPVSDNVRQVQGKLEQYLGGRPAFERLADDLLVASDGLMAHAHALRRLAERFPASTSLTADEQAVLQQIQTEHLDAIRRQDASLQLLAQALIGSGASPDLPATAAPAQPNWQNHAATVFQTAQRLDRLIAMMLSGASADGESRPIAEELVSGLRRLHAQVH